MPEPLFFFIKKEALAQMCSCEFCETFENIYFYRKPLAAASVGRPFHKSNSSSLSSHESDWCSKKGKSWFNKNVSFSDVLRGTETECWAKMG